MSGKLDQISDNVKEKARELLDDPKLQFDMDRLLAPLYGSDKVRQIHVRVGAGHQIDAVPIHQFLFDALGHTTEYPDNQMFLLLALRDRKSVV